MMQEDTGLFTYKPEEDNLRSVILEKSLLTAQHIAAAGEYEVKNAQAMKIMDSFGPAVLLPVPGDGF